MFNKLNSAVYTVLTHLPARGIMTGIVITTRYKVQKAHAGDDLTDRRVECELSL